MSEIECPKKTCMKCGTSCDLLVLVCPNCSEVLPDGKLPDYKFPTEIVPESAEEQNAGCDEDELYNRLLDILAKSIGEEKEKLSPSTVITDLGCD